MLRSLLLGLTVLSIGWNVPPAAAASQQEESQAVAAAQPMADALLKALPPGSSFAARRVFFDPLGQTHVRFQQYYQGIQVFEGEVIVHLDTANKASRGTTEAALSFQPTAVAPGLSGERAQDIARGHFGLPPGLATNKELAILVNGGVGRLAWKVHIEGEGPSGPEDRIAFVGASRGEVLRAWDNLHHGNVNGTAKGMYMGSGGATVSVDETAASTYYLRTLANTGASQSQPTFLACDMRNGRTSFYYVTNSSPSFGTGLISSSGPTAAADAHYGAAKTLGLYFDNFKRRGIDDNWRSTYSRVHYSKSYENAFWSDSCFCMTYGDGATTFYPLVSLDVAGHEMTHGVTATEANLTYSGESGGLNEATSDILGAMVERYANNSLDKPDYLIGEMVMRANWSQQSNGTLALKASGLKALRYMCNPITDQRSPNCYSSTLGSLDVHYSSGVANHFFCLLAEGSDPTSRPTCDNSTLTGIGADKAQQIWYRALTNYMVPSTNYSGARSTTLRAAADLYGANSSEVTAVGKAWDAVSVK